MNTNEKHLEKYNFKESNKYIILTVLLSILILTLTYAISGYYPFGDKSILRVDLYHQYAPFHEELRHKILTGDSLLYSWEGGLGKQLFGQIAYYTLSPISFLILLFPQINLPEAMAFFIFIKLVLCSATFAFYLKKSFKKNDYTIVIFSLFYGFSAFLTSFYWNIMWLDSVFLFPLIALAIERLIKKQKYFTYLFTIALSILVNFYIAFIICVFSVLYFLVYVFSYYSFKEERKQIFKSFGLFALGSLIGGGLTMFLAIPTMISLSKTATSIGATFPNFEVYQNAWQFLANHFLGVRPVVLARNEDLPNIYSGLITIFILPVYFLNKDIKLKEKLLYLALIIFMVLCSILKQLDFLIHGAHFPANLPHRFSFIYTFILLVLGFKAFLSLDKISLKTLMKTLVSTFVVYTLIILISEFPIVSNNYELDRVLTNPEIFINIFLMLIYTALIYLYKKAPEDKKVYKNNIIYAFVVLAVFEASYSSINGFKYNKSTEREKYVKYIDNTNDMLQYVKDTDKDENKFYRMEFRRFTTINDPALYHYNGFSQFSSMAYGATSELIGKLGIASTGNSYRFYDPTELISAMFNIKYIMSKDSEISEQDYIFLKQFDNVYLYENLKHLSLGFMVKYRLLDWDVFNSINPFNLQNNFIYLATDIYEEMFSNIDLDEMIPENLTLDLKVPGDYYYTLDNPKNLKNKPIVRTSIYNDKTQRVFLYVDAGNAQRFKYTINGHTYDRELSTGKSLIDCGILYEGTKIDIEFSLDRIGDHEKSYRKNGRIKLFAAGYNKEVFDNAYNILDDQLLNVYEYDSTNIKGTINVKEDNQIMFTSIPYDEGWTVFVDNEKAEVIPIANNGLIGVKLDKGTHEIEFKYKVQGLTEGLILTIAVVIVLVNLIYIDIKKRKQN